MLWESAKRKLKNPGLLLSAPKTIPHRTPNINNVKPELLKNCLYTYIYIWTKNSDSFWFYPIGLNSYSIWGYGWKDPNWISMRINFKDIDSYY